MEKQIEDQKLGAKKADKDAKAMETKGRMFVNDLWEDNYYKEIGMKTSLRKAHKNHFIKQTQRKEAYMRQISKSFLRNYPESE